MSRMLQAHKSRLFNPRAAATVRPVSICRLERSTPTNRLSGKASAMGSRLPPEAQPSSSTRQFSGGAGCIPSSVASVARKSGCVAKRGRLSYGTSS